MTLQSLCTPIQPAQVSLADGVYRSTLYDDIYFSLAGGAEECEAVFINGNHLPQRWLSAPHFCIAELGFGSGLNFLTTMAAWHKQHKNHQQLTYISFEKHPLSFDVKRQILSQQLKDHDGAVWIDELLTQLPAPVPGRHLIYFAQANVLLVLIYGDAEAWLRHLNFQADAWYLDGFAPRKNEALWSADIMHHVARCSATNATAATYSVARDVRDGLTAAGFVVEKCAGFTGKRERLEAHKGDVHAQRSQPAPSGPIIIHGAGIAGLSIASYLKHMQRDVVVVDPCGVCGGASSNPAAVIHPRLTADATASGLLYLMMMNHAQTLLPRLGFHLSGLMQHPVQPRKDEAWLTRIVDTWGLSPHTAQVMPDGKVWWPKLGAVSMHHLCLQLSRDIDVVEACQSSLDGVHVVATGASLAHVDDTLQQHVQAISGHLIHVHATEASSKVQHAHAYDGYLLPAHDDAHWLGSSYHKPGQDVDVCASDDDILARAKTYLPSVANMWSRADMRHTWGGVRLTVRDRLPIIGQDKGGTWYSIGHGSHGLQSGLWGGLMVAAQLAGFMVPHCPLIDDRLSPQRFK